MKPPNPIISETTTSGAAELVASIDDLLTEIFVHLPLKPLIRFKLVSKHWNSIISDSKLHFTRNHNRAVGLILQNYDRKTLRVVSFNRSSNPLPPQLMVLPDQNLRIFHCCNGLLVLKSTAAAKLYYVYNPTTNQKTPPLLKDMNARPRDFVCGMFLAFNPSKSPHYKVVCVWQLSWITNHMHQYQFEVYSSQTGSWEIRGGLFTGYVDFDKGVYWNGSIHWVGLVGKSIYFNPDHDEIPREMPAPPIHHDNTRHYFFGESCDHLNISGIGDHLPGIYVYEMRRDYSEWFLKYRIDDYSQCLRNSKKVLYLHSVVRGKKDEDEDSFLVLGNAQGGGGRGEIIVLYDLVHGTCETIRVKDFDIHWVTTNSFHYIVSPCSV